MMRGPSDPCGADDFRLLVAHAPDAVLLFDAADTCAEANAAACDLLGYRREQLVGRPLADLACPEEPPHLRRLHEDLAGVRKHREEWSLRREDGGCVRAGVVAVGLSGGRWAAFLRDAADPARAEEALHRERELLQAIIDAIPVMITLYEPDTRVLRLNREFERVIGWTVAGTAGESLMELCYPDPAYREEVRQFMVSCAAGWRDFRMRTRDGRQVETAWANIRLSDGRQVGIGLDVTERRRAERALRDSERMLAQSQRAARVGSWELALDDLDDVNANALRWSDETYRIFGYEPGSVEVTNELFFRAVPPEDHGAITAAVAAALAGGDTYEVAHGVVRPDGTRRVVHQWARVERDPDGRPRRMLGTCQDVTEWRAAEEALREADRRKDEFLAMLGHELRNPLAPIRNGLAVLRQRGGDATTARVLALMERQVVHAARLIDDLLDVSRVTRGVIELRREDVALADVVARAVEEARPALDERRHRLELSVAAEPLVVHADPSRVQQMVTNLLTNAAKYTPPGGQVWLRAGREGGQAVVRVRDNGIGIRPEMRRHIFEMFTQADRVEGRVSEGLGMGLPLVKSLAELHGGSVEVHSEGPGLGSEFVVRLPLALGPAGGPRPAAGPAGAIARPRRVLVVDDNADGAESLAMLLRMGGHEVSVAHDGPAALKAVAAFAPEVVFLDIGMPGMSGYDVAKQLRAQPGSERILLVAMTGYGQEEDRRRSWEAGFHHHLVKPVEFGVLADLLNSNAAGRSD